MPRTDTPEGQSVIDQMWLAGEMPFDRHLGFQLAQLARNSGRTFDDVCDEFTALFNADPVPF